MRPEVKCENCRNYDYYNCTKCRENGYWNMYCDFEPKEELIRKDEREKIINDLEYEIQNLNEVRDSKTIEFIHDFIKELKEK